MIQEPMAVFAFCALICAAIFWSTGLKSARGFYRIVPSVVLVYYLPTIASTLGVIPNSSAAYDWMRDFLLPFSLFILMVTADTKAVLRVGPKALLVMLFGTAGIVIGGPLAYLLFSGILPPDSWKALAALSGSWIGGGGNFAAIKESVGASDTLVGPIIVVDTAVGYTWTGVLLVLANYQRVFDRWNRADTSVIEKLNRQMQEFRETSIRPIELPDVTATLAIGLVGAVACRYLGDFLFQVTDPHLNRIQPELALIFSPFTWMVILVTTFGILFSLTRLRAVEDGGASKIGYAALYIFLTSLGAKADLAGILAAPELLLTGTVWIAIHVGFIFLGARLLRAPLFVAAVGSQANIGGVATAPVVAAAYYKELAPVGLLMGVFGYLIGNYAGLLCAYLLKLAA
jgi:uncharacterized membrane protein